MSLLHAERELRRMGENDLAGIVAGVRGKLGSDIPLPETDEKGKKPQTESQVEQLPDVDLRQQTYEMLSLIRKPSVEETEALKDRGIVFLPADTKTYAQVVASNPAHFWKDELEYANGKPALRDFALPVSTEIGLNPARLAIPGSFGKSMKDQLEMIEAGSQELQQELPDARLVMLPVTAYAQADHAYKETTGEVLFKYYFARCLDMLSGVIAAGAGRDDPSGQFSVGGWLADDGTGYVGAVPAVVFVRGQELAS